MKRLVRAVLLGLAVGVTGCESGPEATLDPYSLDKPSQESVAEVPLVVTATPGPGVVGLRNLAQARGMDIGTAVRFKALSIPVYRSLLASEFNTLTSENEMKWQTIHPEPAKYDWFFGDELVNFAAEHGMKVRGHTLVWHQQLPSWVEDAGTTKEGLLALVQDHCAAVVGHYRGRIGKWDVVNEVVDDARGMRPSVFFRVTGTEFIDTAFRAAHDADPTALLYINDYGVEDVNPKSDRLYALVQGMVARGVPVQGVGFQAHWDLDALPSMDSVRSNIDRFTKLGLRVDVTELDIRIHSPVTPERLARQADAYGALLRVLLAGPGTRSLTVWGLDDGHSWIPGWRTDYGSALILDQHYRPKPAYQALVDALKP